MADKPNETAVLAFLEACADWAMEHPELLQDETLQASADQAEAEAEAEEVQE